MKKAILILMACVIFLLTYLSINTIPEVKIFTILGYNVGMNYSYFWYLKVAYLGLFILFMVLPDNKR